jgi:hypothetical protein
VYFLKISSKSLSNHLFSFIIVVVSDKIFINTKFLKLSFQFLSKLLDCLICSLNSLKVKIEVWLWEFANYSAVSRTKLKSKINISANPLKVENGTSLAQLRCKHLSGAH